MSLHISLHTLLERRLGHVRRLGRWMGIRAHYSKLKTCQKVYERIEHWRRVDGPKLYLPGHPGGSDGDR